VNDAFSCFELCFEALHIQKISHATLSFIGFRFWEAIEYMFINTFLSLHISDIFG